MRLSGKPLSICPERFASTAPELLRAARTLVTVLSCDVERRPALDELPGTAIAQRLEAER